MSAIPKASKPMKLKTNSMNAKIRKIRASPNKCTKSLMCLDCVQALQNFSEAYKSLKPENDTVVAQVLIRSTLSTECLDATRSDSNDYRPNLGRVPHMYI